MVQPVNRLYPGTPGEPLYIGIEPPPPFAVLNELRLSLPSGSYEDYPYQFGRPFRPGEIEALPEVLLDGEPIATQADVKTRHTDGSVKFAVISVVLPSLTTSERVLTFRNRESQDSTPETIANMLSAYDFEATIGIAVDSTPVADSPVSARAMLGDLTNELLAAETAAGGVDARYWTRGPICTTVLLHDHTGKSYDLGTNATKAIRPLFEVQFWPGIGRYKVRHILEVADVTKVKDETNLDITFTTGYASPATKLSQADTGIWNGQFQTRAYWGGDDVPRCNAKHGVEYLADTKVMPRHATTPIKAEVLASYASNWAGASKALGAAGYYNKAMGATGGRPELGLMPKWDAAALVSGDATMLDIAEKHCELFGSFNFFWREGNAGKDIIDSTTGDGRIPSKLSRPTQFWANFNTGAVENRWVIDGSINQTSPNGFAKDDAHTPGAFWFQYVTSGEHIWHEKLLQMAAWSQWLVNPGLSYNSVGNGNASTALIINGVQPRAWGWQFRNRARAWWAALDDSPEQALCDRMVTDALAQQAGLYGIPDYFVGNTIREAWNTNYASWWASPITAGRPNALQWFGNVGSTTGSDPADALRFQSQWMQNYTAMSTTHAFDLGRADAQGFANWTSDLVIQIVLSSRPRLVGLFVFPQVKTDGGLFQTLEDIYDGWSNDGQQTEPATMPLDSSEGFLATSGAPNTYQVIAESYALIASTTIAMANTHPDQAAAWEVLEPWYENCQWFDHDPRYSVKPRT